MVAVKTDAQVSHLADNGLPVTSADVRRLMAEKKALREALEMATQLVDMDVIRVRPSERERLLDWLENANAVLADSRATLRSEQGESDE